MLKVYAWSTDISAMIKTGSMRVVEQLNNRANTASFDVINEEVTYGQEVRLYECFQLTAEWTSWTSTLHVDDTFEFYEIFRAGDEILLNIGGTTSYATIDSINHTTKEIELTANLAATFAAGTVCGRLFFGGTVESVGDREYWTTWQFEYSVNLVERTKSMNKKNVGDTYQDQYPREIISRMMYSFVATDTSTVLDSMEAARTASGVARSMTDETTDKIVWAKAQKTGATWAGTATWTKTITPVDLTGKTDIRMRHKMDENIWSKTTSMKIRVGNDSSNYYERTSTMTGNNQDNCWNRENFKIDRATQVGTVAIATIDWLQIAIVATESIASGGFLFDEIQATSGGFTLKNCIRWDRKVADYRVSYKKPTEIIETLAKAQGIFWLIDYNKDLHLFRQNQTAAPIEITDTSQNYSDLRIEPDMSMIRNRQMVRGGDAPASEIYEQIHVADGQETSRPLDYKPSGITVEVDTGSGYATKTVGIENLNEESAFDFVFNFQEKVLRNAAHATLAATNKIKIRYYPYQSVRVIVTDRVSVLSLKAIQGGDGIVDGPVINDSTILTFEDARRRAKAEIDAYSNAVINARFITNKGNIHAGQLISITDTSRGIAESFLIQRCSRTFLGDDIESAYRIDAGSTMFWLIEFFQLLLKKTSDLMINDSEVVDILVSQDETITITFSSTQTQKSFLFYVCNIRSIKKYDYISQSWLVTATWLIGSQLYAQFTASGEAGIDKSSNYNTGSSLYIDVSAATAGQYIRVKNRFRVAMNWSTDYKLWAWIENLISNGLALGDGLSIYIAEYDTDYRWTLLQTTYLVQDRNETQDFTYSEVEFTTHADAERAEIIIEVNESTWKVSISDLTLEEIWTETSINPMIIGYSEVNRQTDYLLYVWGDNAAVVWGDKLKIVSV